MIRKKLVFTVLCSLCAIIAYRSLNYFYLFYNPIIDDAVLEGTEFIRNEQDADALINKLIVCKSDFGKKYPEISIKQCFEYAIFLNEYCPRISMDYHTDDQYIFYLNGYQSHKCKIIIVDKNSQVVKIEFIIKAY